MAYETEDSVLSKDESPQKIVSEALKAKLAEIRANTPKYSYSYDAEEDQGIMPGDIRVLESPFVPSYARRLRLVVVLSRIYEDAIEPSYRVAPLIPEAELQMFAADDCLIVDEDASCLAGQYFIIAGDTFRVLEEQLGIKMGHLEPALHNRLNLLYKSVDGFTLDDQEQAELERIPCGKPFESEDEDMAYYRRLEYESLEPYRRPYSDMIDRLFEAEEDGQVREYALAAASDINLVYTEALSMASPVYFSNISYNALPLKWHIEKMQRGNKQKKEIVDRIVFFVPEAVNRHISRFQVSIDGQKHRMDALQGADGSPLEPGLAIYRHELSASKAQPNIFVILRYMDRLCVSNNIMNRGNYDR